MSLLAVATGGGTIAATEKSNIEIVEELYKAFNQGDLETCLAGFANNITWTEPEGAPVIARTYHSPDAILENVFKPITDQFDTFKIAVDRFVDGGDTVIMEGALKTTADGEEGELPTAHVIDMEDGKVQEFVSYSDTARLTQLMDE